MTDPTLFPLDEIDPDGHITASARASQNGANTCEPEQRNGRPDA